MLDELPFVLGTDDLHHGWPETLSAYLMTGDAETAAGIQKALL